MRIPHTTRENPRVAAKTQHSQKKDVNKARGGDCTGSSVDPTGSSANLCSREKVTYVNSFFKLYM